MGGDYGCSDSGISSPPREGPRIAESFSIQSIKENGRMRLIISLVSSEDY